MDHQQSVFREAVTRRLAFPEELTEAVTIIRPYDWMIVGALTVILLAAFLWSLIATVPITIHGEGILRAPGTATVLAPRSGIVRRICVGDGVVDAGAVLMAILPDGLPVSERAQKVVTNACAGGQDGHTPLIQVAAPFRARLIEMRANSGDQVTINMPLLVLAPADQPLQATLFVQQNLAHRILPGQAVRLTSEMFPVDKRGGYLLGKVTQVSFHSLSDSGLRQTLDQEDLVRDFIFRGLRVRVDVSLYGYVDSHRDSEMSSSKDLDSTAQVAGARVVGDILVARERPIVWILRHARLRGSE
jgi:hypothetical protein